MTSPQAGISFSLDGQVTRFPGDGAPQDGQVWFDTATTAAVLGVTIQAVSARAKAGRIPFTAREGRRWFRRCDVEVVAASKALKAALRRI